ncbi:MAG: putative toxin-antitoxin system toxin component, PIN family [Anaerolineae bacterium]|nr:putative toxin-antitoxin system toxin component, PIN family [Anaerolineae bacterium]
MRVYQIVIDTNVWIAALRSKRGASHRLLSLIDSGKFEINISVPLILEYEETAKRLVGEIALTEQDIDDILDYVCKVANHRKIYYLWRPFLSDLEDDMVLELAVTSECDFIITFNQSDFRGIERFGLAAITPQQFLRLIGALS